MLVVTSQLGILIAPYKINGYRTRALLASSADVCRLAILAFMDRRKITPILLQGNMLYYISWELKVAVPFPQASSSLNLKEEGVSPPVRKGVSFLVVPPNPP